MADSVSGWGSYRQCDTERDYFPLESWRFLQIISYCLLIPALSMTCLSSGPACNQIQSAAEVAVWVLCSRGLVLWVCLLGEAIYQHEVFRHSQATICWLENLSSQNLPQLPDCSIIWNLQSHCTLYFKPIGSLGELFSQGVYYNVDAKSNKQIMSLFELYHRDSQGEFPTYILEMSF